MSRRFIKFTVLSVVSFLCLTPVFGGMDERLDNLEEEMKQVSTWNPQGNLGANFVSAQPEVVNQYNWFLTFDILYWHAKVGATEYAYSFKPQVSGAAGAAPLALLPIIDGATKENDFGWDLGLKVGLGYKVPHDGWDVYAQYTWFETEDTSASTKPPPSTLGTLRSVVNIPSTKAKSHFDVNYNNVDLELGRNYFISSMITVRPHFGVKSTWLDLYQHAIFTLSPFSDVVFGNNAPFAVGLDAKTKDTLRFWGIGPRVGFDSTWSLGYGFSLFGDFAASILYGYFKDLHRESLPQPLTQQFDTNNGQIIKVKHKFHRFVPYAKMFMGLKWGGYVNNDKEYISLRLGYEVQYYWRVNQMKQPEDLSFAVGAQGNPNVRVQFDRPSEDVMFYGITGEFRLDF